MKNKPLLVGHRGVGAAAPENTLPSYHLAGKLGRYWGVECDIHETADGRFILLHDDTLNDTTNALSVCPGRARPDGGIYAEDLTLAEISVLRVKDRDNPPAYKNVSLYGEVRIPTLEEYLGVCREYSLVPVIEIKQLRRPEEFVRILDQSGFWNNCIVISFVRPALSAVLKIAPDIKNQALFSFDETITGQDLQKVVDEGFGGIDIHYGSVTPECVETAHSMGLTVNAWESIPGVAPERVEYIAGCGVDYITSDTPVSI